jgi:hypothetical protein
MSHPVIHIIFRACDLVNAVNKQPRPFNYSKAELIKICFKSLYAAAQSVPHTITVLGDKLSDEMIDFFTAYNITFSNGNYGNDESIRQSLYAALKLENDNDWVYFCEDDYLHKPETFLYIANLIEAQGKIHPGKRRLRLLSSVLYFSKPGIAIHPTDYPDRYWPKDRSQHFIFHTGDCHWRQVANTTFTFLLQVRDVKKYRSVIKRASVNANDAYLSKALYGKSHFFGKLLCLSPLPGLTAHMHINTMPPLVNWEEVAEQFSEKE